MEYFAKALIEAGFCGELAQHFGVEIADGSPVLSGIQHTALVLAQLDY